MSVECMECTCVQVVNMKPVFMDDEDRRYFRHYFRPNCV